MTTTPPLAPQQPATSPGRPTDSGTGLGTAARWIFRVVITVHTVMLWSQPVLMGLFLSGRYEMLAAHALIGGLIVPTGMLLFISSVLLWKPGGRSPAVIVVAAMIMVGEIVQISSGYLHSLGLHLPLGVALAASGLVLLVWAWAPQRRRSAK